MNIVALMQKEDFLQPLLDLMQKNAERQDERLEKLEGKIDRNTELTHKVHNQTKKTNGRVNQHDKDIKDLAAKIEAKTPIEPVKVKDLSPWYKDPTILKIFLYIALAILITVAALAGINIKELL